MSRSRYRPYRSPGHAGLCRHIRGLEVDFRSIPALVRTIKPLSHELRSGDRLDRNRETKACHEYNPRLEERRQERRQHPRNRF